MEKRCRRMTDESKAKAVMNGSGARSFVACDFGTTA
jgi:hypothetical protein